MDRWEYNTIDQRDFIVPKDLNEDSIDKMLNQFGIDGWELVGWFGVWFIFKREVELDNS